MSYDGADAVLGSDGSKKAGASTVLLYLFSALE